MNHWNLLVTPVFPVRGTVSGRTGFDHSVDLYFDWKFQVMAMVSESLGACARAHQWEEKTSVAPMINSADCYVAVLFCYFIDQFHFLDCTINILHDFDSYLFILFHWTSRLRTKSVIPDSIEFLLKAIPGSSRVLLTAIPGS
jgi:hypothetical protein